MKHEGYYLYTSSKYHVVSNVITYVEMYNSKFKIDLQDRKYIFGNFKILKNVFSGFCNIVNKLLKICHQVLSIF